jgi:preprotein translocase subunit YajC
MHPHLFAFMTAAAGNQGSGALTVVFLQIAALVGIFWFLLIRPQRKQQAEHELMLSNMKKGDEVLTAGGIIGRIVHLKEDRVTIESAESRFVVERKKITSVVLPPAAAEPAQK